MSEAEVRAYCLAGVWGRGGRIFSQQSASLRQSGTGQVRLSIRRGVGRASTSSGCQSPRVKNRAHLDVNAGGGLGTPADERCGCVDAAVERLCGIGATKLRPYKEHGEYWLVIQDVEGNEFCLQ
jgi:hypothetical protein